MVKLNLLAGGNNIAFIASYLFDSDARTLALTQKNPSGQNTSWLERSLVDNSVLYAVNEVEAGVVQSFTIFENGTLSGAASSLKTGGNGPTHIFPSPSGQVSVVNFIGGNGVTASAVKNGTGFGEPSSLTFPVIGAGGASRPHQVLPFENELFVPDAAGDTVWRLVPNNKSGGFSVGGEITQPAGSGPRHAVVRNGLLVTIHDTSNTITSQLIPDLGTKNSTVISDLSIIPKDQANLKGATFSAAEVLLPPPNGQFPTTLVYASNRNLGKNLDPRGDSIAVFNMSAEGKLQLLNQFFTGLQQVRGMRFGGPDDRFLVASGAVGDGGVVVFERVKQGTDFAVVASNKEVPNLTSLVWL